MQRLFDQRDTTHPRRGSTFVVVLALLALLSIVGLAFVTFTGAEKESAEYFVAASNRQVAPQINADDALEFGIRQLVLGARREQVNSALWGGRHSLLAGMFGKDLNPHSGQGIHLGVDANGLVFVDQDFDGIGDTAPQAGLMDINDSPVAQGGYNAARNRLVGFPDPDAGYSYPDINNVFLAWPGKALNASDNLLARAIIPSFHRPQLLRIASPPPGAGQPIANWEVHAQLARKLLRPHRLHQHVRANGNPSGVRRFITDPGVAANLGLSGPFPWGTEDINGNGQLDAGEDANGNLLLDTAGHHGVWTMSPTTTTLLRIGQWVRHSNNTFSLVDTSGQLTGQSGFAPHYAFDADADGDGIKEAIWLDLDHPVRVLADGRKVIPLFAFTVLDADGLANVNTAGNISNIQTSRNPGGQISAISPFGGTEDVNGNADLDSGEDLDGDQLLDTVLISRSNQGLSPSEINPQWILNASPNNDLPPYHTAAELFGLHATPVARGGFGHVPASRAEAANMEWWFALKGAPDLHTAATGFYHPGRVGEEQLLSAGSIQQLLSAGSAPGAGFTNTDDNWNRAEGQVIDTSVGSPLLPTFQAGFRPFRHPLDFRGSGRSTYFGSDPTHPLDPGNPDLNNNGVVDPAEIDPSTWKWRSWMYAANSKAARWHRYQSHQGTVNTVNRVIWNQFLSGQLTPTPFAEPLVDEEAETVVDYRYRQRSDAVFAADENYFLQASNSDIELNPADSRLATLMPFNLRTNRRAESIRHNLTTDSWDLKSLQRSPSVHRNWEFPNGQLNPVLGTPTSPNTGRLRSEVYQLLNQTGEMLSGTLTSVSANVWVQSFAAPVSDPLITHHRTRRYRLGLNHLLTWHNENTATQQLVMRPLTPHPTSLPAAVIPIVVPGSGQNFPPPGPQHQEAWARSDRQRMARDIYSLLYFFCGGRDVDASQTPGIYTESRLREMAQFAVNVVDSMDRDNINTLFEYDKNLSDGWDLDDNPYGLPITQPGGNQESATIRGVVTGVESQELTLGEAFTIVTPMIIDPNNNDRVNHAATEDDDRNARGYGWFEIRNAGTEDVDFSTGSWKLQLQVETGEDANVNGVLDVGDDGDGTVNAYTTSVIPRTTGSGNNQTKLQPGDVLAIGTAADSNYVMVPDPNNANNTIPGNPRPAYLRVDTTTGAGTALKHFAPGNAIPTTRYLDLIDNNTTNTSGFTLQRNGLAISPTDSQFHGILLRGLMPLATALLPPEPQDGVDAQATLYQNALLPILKNQPLYILLKRRLHPGRLPPTTPLEKADNPWITVDRMMIPRESQGPGTGTWKRELPLGNTDTGAAVLTKLNRLRSHERSQPFGRMNSDRKFDDTVLAAGAFCDTGIATTLYNDGVSRGNTIGNTIYGGANTLIENTTSYRSDANGNPILRRFSVAQQHLDRDFASPLELLRVPLYGPDETTRLLKDADLRPREQYDKSQAATNNQVFELYPAAPADATVAAGRFLKPDHPNNAGTLAQQTARDNRWHRLLEFVEVATRMERFSLFSNANEDVNGDGFLNQGDGDGNLDPGEDVNGNGQLDPGEDNNEDTNGNGLLDPFLPENRRHRLPGRINLNTIRDPGVLAALLDEPYAFQQNHTHADIHLFDRSEPQPRRDWWKQFTQSRDQVDPVTKFLLPGMPGSRPFQGFGFVTRDRQDGDHGTVAKNSLEHTLLRSLPLDGDLANDRRRLFELGTRGQWTTNEDAGGASGTRRFNHRWDPNEDGDNNGQLDVPLDLAARQHLNAKIFGNSTVRSHVFHVFLKVEWFEAYQAAGITRIGAKATDVPPRRGFFVIDRSRAIEQIPRPPLAPARVLPLQESGTRVFNFADAPKPFDVAPLILYQKTIE